MTVDPWAIPAGMVGSDDLVRIGTGAAGDDLLGCPSFLSVKIRPRIRSRRRSWTPAAQLETFPLQPVMAALDRVEHGQLSADAALAEIGQRGTPLHPGLIKFARHAVCSYLSIGSKENGLKPVPDWWVVRKTSARIWELYAWGRRYQTADGRHREFRFMRFGEAVSNPDDRTKVAIAAYVTAFGVPAAWPESWREPFGLREAPTVDHARVVEVSLADGAADVLFDGTPADAEAYYAEHGRKRIASIAAGGPARPGSSCAECKQLTSCGTLPRIPGVLALPTTRAPIRTVSMSDLRYHRTCPAQAHLRSLHLPRAYEYGAEAELGHAVHAWLENAHRDGTACDPAAMPTGDSGWSAGRWRVDGDAARVGARMLRRHLDVCALHLSDAATQVRVEPRLAVHDTAAQAIVLAKPDMIYMDDGGWVWRELKTTQKEGWFHDDLLDEFPQLALAVSFLAEGVLGGDPATARVELEVLRPDGAEIDVIDPTDPERLTKARAVLRRLTQPWRADETFGARPSKNCRWCPVSRWCPSFPGSDIPDEKDGGA
ncbi:hypothetical protein CFP71_14685 [Amycolatopsis thailandensis]|uniref:PD-(D/E)XK endonuclease-like domain-containing protein n=1 Tax=Amycolatopsis thailandensis TaxID=589330 RepID=A0A229SB42_9PSEU|nr:PD-(D/E)XK nuclease family protein [Amycolatopsis thailandensis]OXM56162.1 hypothetical protein CFP71_14685 [Amycolatopsis thailandensis]